MNDITANQHEAQPMPLSRGLWRWWALAGMVGFGVGGPLGVPLGTPGYIIENGFMSISLGGVLTGVLQWLVLRRRLAGAGWWAPAGILAAVVFGCRGLQWARDRYQDRRRCRLDRRRRTVHARRRASSMAARVTATPLPGSGVVGADSIAEFLRGGRGLGPGDRAPRLDR